MKTFATILVLCIPWLALAAMDDAVSAIRREFALLQTEKLDSTTMTFRAGEITGEREELRREGALRSLRATWDTGSRSRTLRFHFREGALFLATVDDATREPEDDGVREEVRTRSYYVDGGRVIRVTEKVATVRDGRPGITPAARPVAADPDETGAILRSAEVWLAAGTPEAAAAAALR